MGNVFDSYFYRTDYPLHNPLSTGYDVLRNRKMKLKPKNKHFNSKSETKKDKEMSGHISTLFQSHCQTNEISN